MSLEKNRQEAERWLKTVEGDLDTAIILWENKKYAHSCFHSQQAGEKAIKAIIGAALKNPIFSHKIDDKIDMPD